MPNKLIGGNYYLKAGIGDDGVSATQRWANAANYGASQEDMQNIDDLVNAAKNWKAPSMFRESGTGDYWGDMPRRYSGKARGAQYYQQQGLTSQEALGTLQSNWNRFGNALIQNGVTAGATLLSTIGGTVVGAIQAAAGGNFIDNPVNRVTNKWVNAIKESAPIYHTREYNNKSVVGQAFTPQFWADMVAQAGFTEGMMIAGTGIAAIGAAAGLTGAAATVALPIVSSLIGSIGESSFEAIQARDDKRANNQAMIRGEYERRLAEAQTPEEFEALSQEYQSALNAAEEDERKTMNTVFGANLGLLTLTNSLAFGKVFSRGARATRFAKTQADLAKKATIEARNQLSSINRRMAAGEAISASERAAAQSAVSSAEAAREAARRAAREVTTSEASRGIKLIQDASGAPMLQTDSARKGAIKAGLGLLQTGLSEGSEEMGQHIITAAADLNPSLNTFNESTLNPEKRELAANMLSSYTQAFAEAMHDKEAWQEFAAGFAMGAVGSVGIRSSRNSQGKRQIPLSWQGGIAEAVTEYKEQAKKAETVDKVNAMLADGKYKAMSDYIVGSMVDNDKAMAALNAGDEFNFNNYKNSDLIRLVLTADKIGMGEKLVSAMEESVKNVDADTIRQLQKQGIITSDVSGSGVAESYAASVKKNAAEIRKATNSMLKYKDLAYATFGNVSDEALSQVVYGQMQIDNWKERRDSIRTELKDKLHNNLAQTLSDDTIQLFRNTMSDEQRTSFDKLNDTAQRSAIADAMMATVNLDSFKPYQRNDGSLINPLAALDELRSHIDVSNIAELEKNELKSQLDDLVKINESIDSFKGSMRDLLSNPERLTQSVQNQQTAAIQSEQERKHNGVKQLIYGATTIEDLRRAEQENGWSDEFWSQVSDASSNGNAVATQLIDLDSAKTRALSKINSSLSLTDMEKIELVSRIDELFDGLSSVNDLSSVSLETCQNIINSVSPNAKPEHIVEAARELHDIFTNITSTPDVASHDNKQLPAFDTNVNTNAGENQDTGADVDAKESNGVETDTDEDENIDTDNDVSENKISSLLYYVANDNPDLGPKWVHISQTEALHNMGHTDVDFKELMDYLDSDEVGCQRYLREGKLKTGNTVEIAFSPKGPKNVAYFVHGEQIVGVATHVNQAFINKWASKAVNSNGFVHTGSFYLVNQLNGINNNTVSYYIPINDTALLEGIRPEDIRMGFSKKGQLMTSHPGDRYTISDELRDSNGLVFVGIRQPDGSYHMVAAHVDTLNASFYNDYHEGAVTREFDAAIQDVLAGNTQKIQKFFKDYIYQYTPVVFRHDAGTLSLQVYDGVGKTKRLDITPETTADDIQQFFFTANGNNGLLFKTPIAQSSEEVRKKMIESGVFSLKTDSLYAKGISLDVSPFIGNDTEIAAETDTETNNNVQVSNQIQTRQQPKETEKKSNLTDNGRNILRRRGLDENNVDDFGQMKANLIGEIVANHPELNSDDAIDDLYLSTIDELNTIINCGL